MTNNDTMLRRTAWMAGAACAALLLAGCGHKREATQSAARVDGTEITISQINFRLQRERGLRPEQRDAVSRKVLDQLIDEQLLVERAEKVKMDEQPEAQQALLAARREVLARSYVEQAAMTVAAPTDQQMHEYFDSNDALFSHRRIYTLDEFLARVPEAQIPTLRAMVDAGKQPADIEAWFKAQNAPYRAHDGTYPAERIPLASLKQIAATPDGHGLVISAGDQVHVTFVASSVAQPVTFENAKPAIGQFLLAEARRKVTEANMAALRSSAKIDYAPQYAALAASGPALATTRDIESQPQIPASSGTHVTLPAPNTSSGVQVTLPTTTTSGVQVTLPQTQGVRVSLPSTPASSVEVRLPPQTTADAPKK